MSLPEQNLEQIYELLISYQNKRRTSLKQFQNLAGNLSLACSVVRGGRVYLQCILYSMRPLQQSRHKVQLITEFQADISWWLACRVGSVGSVSASHTVGCEFVSRSGHTKDHHKNGTNCLPAQARMR